MRVTGFVAVVAFCAVAAVATLPRGWVDLFAPPFDNCPSVMMAVSCVAQNSCYIVGSGGDTGFGVLTFDGQPNGNFGSLNMPVMDLMLMAISVGGTAESPAGAVGGMGFGDSVQYFANKTTLLPSTQPFFVVTQDIRSSNDGQTVLVVDQGGSNSVLVSTNAGMNFTNYPITSNMPNNETFSRYGAIADANTWYITLGNWPDSSSSGSSASASLRDRYQISPRRSIVRDAKTGKWKHQRSKRATDVDPNGYSCVIAKTSDAGQTWENVMFEATSYYPNGIDCYNATLCAAVGEGFNEHAGAHVWLTVDGQSFQQALHMKDNASGQFSFMSVKFNGPNEIWVGGSFEQQSTSAGLFYYSGDGGNTWSEQGGPFEFIGDITDISFTTDGVGFATAITIFDDSTILRYDSTGPNPTPSPTWNGNITQVQCTDSNCKRGCTTVSFPQLICEGLNGGGSAIAQCTNGIIEQWVYPFSNNCTGLYEMQPMPIDQCLQANGGGSFENYCGPRPKAGGASQMSHSTVRPKMMSQAKKL